MYAEFRVGIGVFVFDPSGKFIVGKRKGSFGSGTWSLPGGHLDLGESFEQCAAREVREETGIVVKLEDVRFLTAINDHLDEELKHYITIFMGCCLPGSSRKEGEVTISEPQNLEPDKCEGWEWSFWEDLIADSVNSSPLKIGSETATIENNTAVADVTYNISRKRELFKPLSNLINQQPAFDPLQTYLAARRKPVKTSSQMKSI